MPGRFTWYELNTTDADAAIAFYSELLGWRTEPFAQSPGGSKYRMWVSPQGPLGGVMQLSKELQSQGVAPHWWAHIDVADVDATVAQVQALGGEVHVPPTDIPTVGRFSVVADPQGAMFSAFHPTGSDDPTDRDPMKHGEFCWRELHAHDGEAAWRFYQELFGWKIQQEMDMGAQGTYRVFGQGDRWYGGIMTGEGYQQRSAWMYFLAVEDLDQTIARAEATGGRKLYGPHAIPGGRMAHLLDPQGAVFGVSGP
jgi:uncharacterized protein